MTMLPLEQILYNIPAIIVAFTFHEYMHAYVSDKLGDPTPRMNGRLTLNPIVHIDWIGFIMILIMGFGWAKPVQINPRNYKNPNKGKILVSLAGPLTNLALAFVFFAIFYFSSDFLSSHRLLANYIYPFIWINIVLFAFNILPVPPLDGFSLLEAWIPPSKYRSLEKVRQYGFVALIALSFLGVLGIYINFVADLLYSLFAFIFGGIAMFVGLF